jgi:hypothetical protein
MKSRVLRKSRGAFLCPRVAKGKMIRASTERLGLWLFRGRLRAELSREGTKQETKMPSDQIP